MTSLKPLPSKRYPLSIILTSSGMDAATPGSCFELGVTIHNVGDRSAIIYIFIEERTPVLRQWCRTMQERLALAPDKSGEVVFPIEIPPTALPEIVEYDLVVDGSDSYQDFPPRRYDHYQLQILPGAQTVGGTEEPTFYLEPTSSSRQPLVIQPSVSQQLQVWVDNRAERVDRFRLRCMGLPDDWKIDIAYPRDTQEFGLIVEADSLGLNPGDRGQILVAITPPINALAGIYTPTLRLISANQPDINLLDLVYFQVNPTYQLQAILQLLRNQVRTQPALFEVQLDNLGNTPREVRLSVENLEEPDSCAYALNPSQITIPPQQASRAVLTGMPQKWRQRPFYGGGRFFNFRVTLADPENHPIAVNTLPGNLLWLPRPWWQLALVILSALGLIGVLLWMIWLIFFKPPVSPQLLSFEAEDSRYAEANGEFARVQWDIANAHRIGQLILTGLSPEGEILSSPLTYSFEQGRLPQALLPFCAQYAQQLTCTNVRTNASKPGTYQFKLAIAPRGQRPKQPIMAQSSQVVIEPAPAIVPIVTDFFASELFYQEAAAPNAASQSLLSTESSAPNPIDNEGIRLNWTVANLWELATLKLEAWTGDDQLLGERLYAMDRMLTEVRRLPENLQGKCQLNAPAMICLPERLMDHCILDGQAMICQNVPTQIFQVGAYKFGLTAAAVNTPDPETEPTVTETEVVTIKPIIPEIAQFLVDGKPADPKYLIPVNKGEPPPVITLSWEIRGGSSTLTELLPVPGPVPLSYSATLPLNPMGSSVITLKASNPEGEMVSQSVQIETFNPNPEDPAAAAAAAAAAAVAGGGQNGGANGLNIPAGRDSVDQDRIAPRDAPPLFD
ncbi:MAG: hypothetical protein QNJ46_11645 [Leptolyngbyaceae cyanobacterium MO_188.B28]|nr:hypothetical protein [Leptolyngbyaceae cyanobacterium MO_188.B28]